MKARLAGLGILILVGIIIYSGFVHAQSQLVPLVTDKTPIPGLSGKFGQASAGVINSKGDYAFVGNGQSGVFLRYAASGAPVRVYQAGDEVPGFPDSRGDIVSGLDINNSGVLAFKISFALANGQTQGAIFTYNGISLTLVVSGLDSVPGMSGVKFGSALSLIGLNDSGDVAFTAPLGEAPAPPQTTMFIRSAGGNITRVVGLNDPFVDSNNQNLGPIKYFSPLALNNRNEILFRAGIQSGVSGLFVGVGGSIRCIATTQPNDIGLYYDPVGMLNNNGQVAFTDGDASIWIYSPTPTPNRTRVLAVHQTTDGWTLDYPGSVLAFNDQADIAFACTYGPGGTNPPYLDYGLFRYRLATGKIEPVANRHQLIANDSQGRNFIAFYGVSINSSGMIGFRASIGIEVGSDRSYGIFEQTGSDLATTLSLQGSVAPTGGTYFLGFSVATQITQSGEVYFPADLPGGAAYYGEFLASPGSTRMLMSTADDLPPNSNVLLRTFHNGAAGDYVGFMAQHAGGNFSIAAHRIETHETSLVLTEGELESALGNARVRIRTRNTVFVNSSGSVAFGARIVGDSSSFVAIILATSNGELKKIAAEGDPVPGTPTVFNDVSLIGLMPSPLNESGEVVFQGNFWTDSGKGQEGIFVGTEDQITRVAATGDAASDGSSFATHDQNNGQFFFSINSVSINNAGDVAFLANTVKTDGTKPGIYLWPGSGQPAKVVRAGDPGPSSKIFTDFGYPALNNSGQVAFFGSLAPTANAPRGGVFLGTTSSVVPLFLEGEPLPFPANGYVIDAGDQDIQINDRGDVVFRIDLAGGSSDSGYFLYRLDGTKRALVLQGQTAPGTGNLAFSTIPKGTNGFLGENFQLNQTGDMAFLGSFQDGGVQKLGTWRINDYTGTAIIEPVVVRGFIAPEFGGGTAVTSLPSIAWNSGRRYPVWARISGGTFTDGVFLSVPTVPTSTQGGTDIAVQPVDSTTGTTAPVSMVFDTVSQAGNTTVTSSSAGPEVPANFNLGSTPMYYDISTTAAYSGPIEVCIDTSTLSFPEGSQPSLLHYEGGNWVDVTTGYTDTQVCGQVASLSPFTVAQIPMTLDVTLSPSVLWPPNNKMVRINADIRVNPGSPYSTVQLISIMCNEPIAKGDIQTGNDPRTFQLRATRLGSGNGRAYAVTYRATHSEGYSIVRTVYVLVPHDKGK